MKKFIKKGFLLLIPAVMLSVWSCKEEFLEQDPLGQLSDSDVQTKLGAEELVIGAYAMLDGVFNGNGPGQWSASGTNWVYGSVAGGDAHKGSNQGDQSDINPIERYEYNATNPYFNAKWQAVYQGVGRANAAIRAINGLDEEAISAADKKSLLAQAIFLRGHYHFEAKRMWNKIPYVDETVTYAEGNYNVPNTLPDAEIWAKIQADFQHAYDNLDGTLAAPYNQIGRVNKWAAGAYLGKVLLYQGKHGEAKAVFDQVIANGTDATGDKYKLAPQFHYNFNVAFENGAGYDGTESVFAIQASLAGGVYLDANYDLILNGPAGPGAPGCCGFFQPSFELANSYRVSPGGLPLTPAEYNGAQKLVNDFGIESNQAFTPDAGPLDPRLDWTVGRRGIPYLDYGINPGNSWVRDRSNAGPYASIKHIHYKGELGETAGGASWGEPINALNYNLIRFADVLLMAAECEMEAGDPNVALGYVNQIRLRASNPDGFVKTLDGSAPAANYVISQYPAGSFADPTFGVNAIRFERKLELAMEGHRFFDLVRWGIAGEVLNAYIAVENQYINTLDGASFDEPTDNYYPIPQTQIDLQNGALEQNR